MEKETWRKGTWDMATWRHKDTNAQRHGGVETWGLGEGGMEA